MEKVKFKLKILFKRIPEGNEIVYLSAKNEQLTELKSTIVTSVEDTVKIESKSYSEAVNQSSSSRQTL